MLGEPPESCDEADAILPLVVNATLVRPDGVGVGVGVFVGVGVRTGVGVIVGVGVEGIELKLPFASSPTYERASLAYLTA